MAVLIQTVLLFFTMMLIFAMTHNVFLKHRPAFKLFRGLLWFVAAVISSRITVNVRQKSFLTSKPFARGLPADS